MLYCAEQTLVMFRLSANSPLIYLWDFSLLDLFKEWVIHLEKRSEAFVLMDLAKIQAFSSAFGI